MGAKAFLRTGVKAMELTQLNRCYMIADSGEEVKVTKEMIRHACSQLLARCKK
ncbi:PA1571 family protein [Acinetobacter qingfengensis]|uniref:PA1571 family protein n=1 Tax=Acinetobacter qingfengensis TaxID=1262585 RepID=UPI0014876848|nr:PA1571 family protein [Acinetobacter qingfengensis]